MDGYPNGTSPADTTGEEEDAIIGPGPAAPKSRKKRPLQFEKAFLDALPSAHMYFKFTYFLLFPLLATSSKQISMNCLQIPA
jgi:hypothetical protein